jgi:hypothetical protein
VVRVPRTCIGVIDVEMFTGELVENPPFFSGVGHVKSLTSKSFACNQLDFRVRLRRVRPPAPVT